MLTIGFAGMTHLGINTAVATAERGFNIIGYDSNSTLINALKCNQLPITEPDLPELFEKHVAANHLNFSDDIKALHGCDIVYLSLDVHTDSDGSSDLSAIQSLAESVSQHLHDKAVMVMLAQVPPGFTRKLTAFVQPSRLYYQVETLIFGRAMERARYPERFIVGCADTNQPLDPRYHKLLQAFDCPVLHMNYESAELAKIAINSFLVASLSVTNTLSELCEKLGANWSDIAPALKLDKRIGPHAYLKPGLGFAGGNLERDMATLIRLSSEHGTDIGVVKSFVHNNQYRKDWVLKTLYNQIFVGSPEPKLGVLGLAYKENTHSIKNSPAVALLGALKHHTYQAYDPAVAQSALPWVTRKQTLDDVIQGVDVLIIMTPWEEFKSLTPAALKKTMRGRYIIDPYGLMDETPFVTEGFQYFTLGRS